MKETPESVVSKFKKSEEAFREKYWKTAVTVEGRVVDRSGKAIPGVFVEIGNVTKITDSSGNFTAGGVLRSNRLMSMSVPGYRTERIPVYLNVPLTVSTISLGDFYLEENDTSVVRFLFAGDTAFGRRYLDPLELIPRDQMPPDNPGALIMVSDPEPGTKSVVRYFRPFFQDADFRVINFETPVTIDVSTPHPTKDYVYFTLPGSLPALRWLGVDYVSLGNNHVYDYLEKGLSDTLANLDAAGVFHSGAGPGLVSSFLPFRTTIKSWPYSFLSMTSITGRMHDINYVAEETKGGAADLSLSDYTQQVVSNEAKEGYIPILQLHGGMEYTYAPNTYLREAMNKVVESGAALVISHHPHVGQGVGIINNVPAVFCLGNFAFDQDRLETFLGAAARVDMKGSEVNMLRLFPVYIEKYCPKPVGGRRAGLLMRRVCEFSEKSARVFPYNGEVWVEWKNPDSVISESRTVDVDMELPDPGVLITDLRQWARDNESLSAYKISPSVASVRFGRDIMVHGDFEDYDADDDNLEVSEWDIGNESVSLSMSTVYRGTGAVASMREAGTAPDSVIPFRYRVRVMGDATDQPNKDLTFFGYVKGETAGAIRVVARFAASEEDNTFGEENVYTHAGGTFGWQAMVGDIHMPPDDPAMLGDPTANPRAVNLYIHHSPPSKGSGVAFFDEIAIISWEESLSAEESLANPHGRDFLKIAAAPGKIHLTLTFTSYRPKNER